ncbi:hypothetical protein LguiA_024164 [Lonicera macranthoides]
MICVGHGRVWRGGIKDGLKNLLREGIKLSKGKKIGIMMIALVVVCCITVVITGFALEDHSNRKLFVGSIALVASIAMYGSPLVVVPDGQTRPRNDLAGVEVLDLHRRVKKNETYRWVRNHHGDGIAGSCSCYGYELERRKDSTVRFQIRFDEIIIDFESLILHEIDWI